VAQTLLPALRTHQRRVRTCLCSSDRRFAMVDRANGRILAAIVFHELQATSYAPGFQPPRITNYYSPVTN
jgi:hypothetical protein